MKTFMTLVMLLACGIHAVLSVDGNESSANLSGNSNWIYQFGTVLLAVILIGWSLYRFTRTPTVETLEANYTALIGERVELKCSVAATPWITSVSWQLILPGGRSVPLIIDQRKYKGSKPYDPHLVINELTKDDEGEYVCTVSNLCGKGQSAPTKLNVEGDFPTVRIHERNYTAVLGEQVKLECTISAIPWITTVSWQRISPEEQPVALDIDEIKYTGSKPNDPHLSINDIKKDDEGDYVCTVSNLCGKRQSAPTKLKVKGGPPTLNMKPKKHYKTEGDVAILKCNVIAEPPASDITWTKEEEGCKRKIATDNDKYYGGLLESPSLVIDETEKMHDEGKYICEAENLAGPGSNSVHLTINSKSANTETIPDALILNEDNPYTLEERATDCHSMMVNKLSGVIYPASDCWENFKQLLKGRLPPVVLQKDNLHLYVQKLLDANRIQIGQYKPLYKAVKGVNKCASGIIKEAESEIKTIRRQGMPNETPAKLECKFQGRYINPNLPVMCTCQMQKQCPEVNGRIKGTGGSGCIYLKFTISEAKTPHQLSALYLAEILKTRLENRQIVLKDESDQPLVLKHSPRVMIPTENPTDIPTIRLSRGHYRFTEGKVAILKCVVVATAETETVQWVRVKDGKFHAICIDNEKYFGGLPKSPSLAIGDVEKSDRGIYFCRARNIAGEVESNVAFVEITSIGDFGTRKDFASAVKEDVFTVEEEVITIKEDVSTVKEEISTAKEDVGAVMEDTGAVMEDTGAVMKDASAVMEDTGAVMEDTGAVMEDAGAVMEDAGAVMEDTSAVMEDTGAVMEDTGAVMEDANAVMKDASAVTDISTMEVNVVKEELSTGLEDNFGIKGLYKANSEELMKERIAHEHAKMVTELSEYVSPKLDTWSKFRESIRWALPPAYLEEDLNSIVESLMKKHHIDYGQYQTLYEAVDKFDRNPSIIIKKAEAHIKAIRDGVSPMKMDVSKAKKEFGFDLDTRPGIRGTPTVETLEANYTALIGERVELKCSVAATPWITSVSWQHILPGGRSVQLNIDQWKYKGSNPYDPHLVINELTKDDEGEYVCTVSNLCGKGQSAPTKLNVEGDVVSPMEMDVSRVKKGFGFDLDTRPGIRDVVSPMEMEVSKAKKEFGFELDTRSGIRDGGSPMEMDVSKAKKEFGFDLDTRPGIRDEVSSRKKGVSTVEKELGIGTRSEIRDSANEPKPKPDVESNPELKDAFSTELKFVPDSEHENAPQPKPVDVPKTERLVVSETGFKGKDGPELETEVKFNQEPQDELADEPKFVSNLEPEDLPIPEPVEDPKTETLDEPEVALTEKGDTYRRLAQKYNLTDDCVVPVKDASNQEELIIIYDPSCNKERKLKEFGHDIMIRNPKYVSTEGAIVSSICKTEQYSIKPEDRNNLKQALRHHSKRLFASHSNLNIITTSPVKSKNKGADIIECLCIVVVCSSKGYIPKGESKFPEELIFENTSFVIDVREGYFQFGPTSYSTFNSSLFHQHIKMGCSFGIEGTHNAGTVGPFVDFQGHQLFLTCAHIVTGVDPNGYDLNNIQNMFAEQPDAITFSDPQNRGYITRRCGEVRRAVFLPNNSPSVDAAVVEITEQSRMPSRGEFAIDDKNNIETAGFDDLPRFESGDIHDNPDTLHTDLRTVKFGAKTHATRGVISSVGTFARPLTTDLGLQGQPNTCVMKNQIEVFSLRGHSNFFLPGDSGSGVFEVNTLPTGEQKLTCIGLAIGCTSYGSAVVTPIAAVLDALELPRNLKQFP